MTAGVRTYHPHQSPTISYESLQILLKVAGVTTLCGGGSLLLTRTLLQAQAENDLSQLRPAPSRAGKGRSTVLKPQLANSGAKPTPEFSLPSPMIARQTGTGFNNTIEKPESVPVAFKSPQALAAQPMSATPRLTQFQLPTDTDAEPETDEAEAPPAEAPPAVPQIRVAKAPAQKSMAAKPVAPKQIAAKPAVPKQIATQSIAAKPIANVTAKPIRSSKPHRCTKACASGAIDRAAGCDGTSAAPTRDARFRWALEVTDTRTCCR
jgi:hypothetical protein